MSQTECWDPAAWEEMMAHLGLLLAAGENAVDPVMAANVAPYKIFQQGGKWVVKNNAGDVKATFDSRAKALKYLRALYANVPGAAKKADRTKWTGTAPEPK